MNPTEWEKNRSILNHDVLCNQLRNELVRLRKEPCSKSFIRIAMWPKRQDEYIDFLDSAMDVLSPGEIVDSFLFACWDSQQRELFKLLVRNLYNEVENIESQIKEAKSILTESISLIESFFSTPIERRTTQAVIKIQDKLDELSKRISKLPHHAVMKA